MHVFLSFYYDAKEATPALVEPKDAVGAKAGEGLTKVAAAIPDIRGRAEEATAAAAAAGARGEEAQ